MNETYTIQLPESKGPGTTYNYVEQVLDTPIFDDDFRSAAAESGDLAPSEYEQRHAVGLSVARSIAKARWQQRLELKHTEDYQRASVYERTTLVSPEHETLDDLRANLESHRHRVQHINSIERYVEKAQTGPEASVLREGQHDVFDALKDFLNSPGQQSENHPLPTLAGYIKMPTGMGKTVVAVEMVRALDYPKTLILTSRKDILKQTVGKDGKRGFSQFAPDAHVTSYYQDDKDLSGNVVVMTYASFNNLLAKGELDKDAFDLLVCDEIHEALGTVSSKNIREYSEGKIAIGLTATDEYAENKKVSQVLPECIYEIGLRECINNGWLSPAQAWVYKTNVEIDRDARHEFSSAELHRLSEVAGRNQKGVEFAKSFIEQGMQGIISCIPGENVRHAEDIAAMLKEIDITDTKTGEIRKIRAQEMRGDMSEAVRQDIYARYEAGEIDVLTFVDMLTTGWDSNRAKFLINLRPTCSPVFGTQRLGRILRPTGKGYPAQVVDFVDITKKAQFTALHALGEYRYQTGKIYASRSYAENGGYKRINLPGYLQQHINGVNMRKVADIVVGRPYEADYSELLCVHSVAESFSLADVALLHIAQEQNVDIYQAQGGLGAPTAQIREIDRDKIAKVVHTRYEWLKGKSAEWVQDYVARRQARIQAMQVHVTAEVVDTRIEQSHRATEEKPVASPNAEPPRTSKMFEAHKDKDLDTLIAALSKGNINGHVFKRIIGKQAKEGTIKPLSVVQLIVGGKQPGLFGEVQELAIRNLMESPSVAMAAVNIAKQLGHIKDIQNQMKKNGLTTRCHAIATLADNTKITVEGEAMQDKTAQQLAALHTLARIADVDLSDVENPHTTIALDDIPLPDIDNPKGKIHNIFSKRPDDIQFYGMGHEMPSPDTSEYFSKVVFKIWGRTYRTIGKGRTYKAAQQNAALRAFALYEDVLQMVNGPDPNKVAKLERQARATKPSKFLTIRSEKLELKSPKYENIVEEHGQIPTVTIVDNSGENRTFRGPLVPNIEHEDEAEQKKRMRSARAIACQAAVDALYPQPDANKSESNESRQ